jgi:two-component system chemotaxis response regulator CheB
VIGGSAGALDALLSLVGALPADFSGAIFIVSHVGANRSQLPELLTNAGRLTAIHAQDGMAIRPGCICVAPPDRHMLVERDRVRLTRGPREHFTRPAIDPTFCSAARAYGASVIGIVLSGTGSDGTAGLEEIRERGGVTIVQAPSDAMFPEMPQTAASTVRVEHVVTSSELGALLIRLLAEPVAIADEQTELEASTQMNQPEKPAALTCPECGGALREESGTALQTYRCHTGHRFAANELLAGQLEEVDRAIEVAMRVLNEQSELCRRMIQDAQRAGRTHGIAYWTNRRDEAAGQFATLHRFLLREHLESSEP